MDSLRQDTRAVSAVLGKTLAVALALLYIGGMMTVLLGGVVPDYRTASGGELGDRVLATAAGTIEGAPTGVDGTVDTRQTVDLPATIRNTGYTIVLSDRTLALRHPAQGIGSRIRLSLPPDLTVENSTWDGGGDLVVRVSGPTDDRRIRIEEGR